MRLRESVRGGIAADPSVERTTHCYSLEPSSIGALINFHNSIPRKHPLSKRKIILSGCSCQPLRDLGFFGDMKLREIAHLHSTQTFGGVTLSENALAPHNHRILVP